MGAESKRKAKKPVGRPTDFSMELSDLVCERLAVGESMRSIARDESMPAMSSLFKWLRIHPEFAEQYDRAKVESADAMSEDCLDIADNIDGSPVLIDGVPVKVDGNLVKIIDSVSVQHAKLKVDTRKWLMSKMKPKKYGDKIQAEHIGQVGISFDLDYGLQKDLGLTRED